MARCQDPVDEEAVVELPEEIVDDVRKRLRRIAGQVEGIERMLAEGRECRDVVIQLRAVSKAVDRAGFKLVAAGLTWCVAHPEAAEEGGYPMATVEKMFMDLA